MTVRVRGWAAHAGSDVLRCTECDVDCVELGVHELRGRAISLRWLEHNGSWSDSWTPAHITWLVVVLLTTTLVLFTVAFKYRRTVCRLL